MVHASEPSRHAWPAGPALAVRRRPARLALGTYGAASALAWALWAALAVSADGWLWWLLVPLAGWTAVLALHVVHARRGSRPVARARRRPRPRQEHARAHARALRGRRVGGAVRRG